LISDFGFTFGELSFASLRISDFSVNLSVNLNLNLSLSLSLSLNAFSPF
jgi:hypothetical protein